MMRLLLLAAVVVLGTAASPSPDPAGSGGANPGNYRGSWWIVVGIVAVVVIIGAGTLYLVRTRRLDLTPTATDADEPPKDVQPGDGRHSQDEHPARTDRGN